MTSSDDQSRTGPAPIPLSAGLDGVVRSLRAGAGRGASPSGAAGAPAAGSSAAGPTVAGPTVAGLGGLFRGWADAVGPQVAAHVRPVVLDRGRLVVEVDQPGWATQMRFLEADLLARLRPFVAPEPIESVEVRVAGAKGSRHRPRSPNS